MQTPRCHQRQGNFPSSNRAFDEDLPLLHQEPKPTLQQSLVRMLIAFAIIALVLWIML